MNRVFHVGLQPGLSNITIQLFHRVGNGVASDLIFGVVDDVEKIMYRFDLSGIALGDYYCQLSGVSEPNAPPFPFRILKDGGYYACNWRSMDSLYPEETTLWELHWLRMKALGATHQDIALRWLDLHPDTEETLKSLTKRSKNEVARQKSKAGME